jgi:hypothetical protein
VKGFKYFCYMAAAAVIVGLCLAYVPACQPEDKSDCEWNADNGQYVCPVPIIEENK